MTWWASTLAFLRSRPDASGRSGLRRHDADSQRLVDLARTQTIEAPEIAAAWWGFVEALDNRWFLPRDLDSIIDAVRTRRWIGNEEFAFDFEDAGDDQVISRFISDEYPVSAAAIVAELETLRRRYRDEPAASAR